METFTGCQHSNDNDIRSPCCIMIRSPTPSLDSMISLDKETFTGCKHSYENDLGNPCCITIRSPSPSLDSFISLDEETFTGCKHSNDNDVGSPCCIMIRSPTPSSDSVISLDKETFTGCKHSDENDLGSPCCITIRSPSPSSDSVISLDEETFTGCKHSDENDLGSPCCITIRSPSPSSENVISLDEENFTGCKHSDENDLGSPCCITIRSPSPSLENVISLDEENFTGCKHSNDNDVGSPCCIMIRSPSPSLDSLISSDEELSSNSNIVNRTESENFVISNSENEAESHPDKYHGIEPEYIMMQSFDIDELESYPDKNNDILELYNKRTENYETSIGYESNEDSDSFRLVLSPFSDCSVDSDAELYPDDDKTKANYENEEASHITKDGNVKQEIFDIYEKSGMLHINQVYLFSDAVDKDYDTDLPDLITVDSNDIWINKEEARSMKEEEINQSNAFDFEKENIPLQSNVKRNMKTNKAKIITDYLLEMSINHPELENAKSQTTGEQPDRPAKKFCRSRNLSNSLKNVSHRLFELKSLRKKEFIPDSNKGKRMATAEPENIIAKRRKMESFSYVEF